MNKQKEFFETDCNNRQWDHISQFFWNSRVDLLLLHWNSGNRGRTHGLPLSGVSPLLRLSPCGKHPVGRERHPVDHLRDHSFDFLCLLFFCGFKTERLVPRHRSSVPVETPGKGTETYTPTMHGTVGPDSTTWNHHTYDGTARGSPHSFRNHDDRIDYYAESAEAPYQVNDNHRETDDLFSERGCVIDWSRHLANAVVCDVDRMCAILSINGYERNCNPRHCAMVSMDYESAYEPIPICMFSLILREVDGNGYSDFFNEMNRRVSDYIEESEALVAKCEAILSELEDRLSQIDEMSHDGPSREPYLPQDYLEAATNRYQQYEDGVNRRLDQFLGR